MWCLRNRRIGNPLRFRGREELAREHSQRLVAEQQLLAYR